MTQRFGEVKLVKRPDAGLVSETSATVDRVPSMRRTNKKSTFLVARPAG